MKYKKIIFWILLFSHCGNSKSLNAQEYRSFTENAIYLQSGGYIKNGRKHSYGFLFRNLRSEMTISEDAQLQYQKFNNKLGLSMVGVAVTTTLLFVGFEQEPGTTKNTYLLFAFGSGLATRIISNAGKNALHRAVWHRNQTFLY